MNLLGIHLQLLMGPTVPVLAPLKVNEALQSVEVTHNDTGRSGFNLTFQIGRGPLDVMDYSLLKNPLLKPFNRVILNVFFGIKPIPIMDGIITTQQLAPGNDPGSSRLTLIGEDISVMMDLEQESGEFPGLPDDSMVKLTLLPYTARFGLIPKVESPETVQAPAPDERTSQRSSNMTDLAYINELAGRYGFVFYIEPGPVPGANIAHWAPPNRRGEKQKALSVNMGPNTNVNSISFGYNSLAPNKVTYTKRDGSEETLETASLTSRPPLVTTPAEMKRRIFLTSSDGLDDVQRRAHAQGELDRSTDEVVTATGELDALRYGQILKPRSLVDLRGAGASYDGTYYVKSVTHAIDITKGEYKQSFTLTREGTGTLSPFVSV